MTDRLNRAADGGYLGGLVVGTGASLVIGLTVAAFLLYSYVLTNTEAVAQQHLTEVSGSLEAIPHFTDAERAELRTHLNPAHVASARQFGVDGIRDRDAVEQLVAEHALIPLISNEYYSVQRMRYSLPYVTADKANLLKLIGVRFQEALRAEGLPAYRFVITSATRTREDQVALTRVNTNAARSRSSHEFGTTVDIHYARFSYAGTPDLPAAGFGVSNVLLRQLLREGYTRLTGAHHDRLKGVLGRVLTELQAEGVLLVIYERLQPVFHVTLHAPVDDPLPVTPPGLTEDASSAGPQ
jgi:hypothetical protein